MIETTKPLLHWLVTLYAAEQPLVPLALAAAGDAVAVRGATTRAAVAHRVLNFTLATVDSACQR